MFMRRVKNIVPGYNQEGNYPDTAGWSPTASTHTITSTVNNFVTNKQKLSAPQIFSFPFVDQWRTVVSVWSEKK
jgi:hypothetical protein